MSLWNSIEQQTDSLSGGLENDGTGTNIGFPNTPAMSTREGVAVVGSGEDGAPEVEISVGQKMLSAVSGSILTSLIGMECSHKEVVDKLIVHSHSSRCCASTITISISLPLSFGNPHVFILAIDIIYKCA